jgi:DNA-binding transcriptional regulator/RsmH inhibitor MraZ
MEIGRIVVPVSYRDPISTNKLGVIVRLLSQPVIPAMRKAEVEELQSEAKT